MVDLARRVFEASLDILTFEVGITFEDLGFGGSCSQHLEHIFDPNAHTPNTWPAGALFGVEGDAVQLVHFGAYHVVNSVSASAAYGRMQRGGRGRRRAGSRLRLDPPAAGGDDGDSPV